MDTQSLAAEDGNLILVTAINPTPAGEGRTRPRRLTDALNHIAEAMMCLRERSLGRASASSGAAAAASQVIPMEDITCTFPLTSRHHVSAQSALGADRHHIYWGNALASTRARVGVAPRHGYERPALREIVCSLGGSQRLSARSGFDITVVRSHGDLLPAGSRRPQDPPLGNIISATPATVAVRARSSKRMAPWRRLKDAIAPNLGADAGRHARFIHGGHRQHRPWLQLGVGDDHRAELSDYVVTEAGFGADLGAEKSSTSSPQAGSSPDCVVIVRPSRAEDAWRSEED